MTADDPSVTITGLALDGVPVAITGRGEGNVQFEIKGSEQGIVCQRDLGLTLSDGRQVTQPVNLCLNDWQVKVVVAGAAPGGSLPAPPPPPAAPGTGVTALPVPVAEGMVWSFAAGEIAGTLVYGVPETDATALVATCNRGSDRITVTLYNATVPGLQPGAPVPVNFFAGGFTKAYQGKMTAVSEESGVAHPEVVISAGDPLWSALIRETNLGISAGPAYSATLSLKGSAAPARQLLATCLNAPAPPPAARPPVAVAPGGGRWWRRRHRRPLRLRNRHRVPRHVFRQQGDRGAGRAGRATADPQLYAGGRPRPLCRRGGAARAPRGPRPLEPLRRTAADLLPALSRVRGRTRTGPKCV